jgi:acyl carrier protein
MSTKLFGQVADLVADETGVRRERITPETIIEDDLGCTGVDAEELIIRFSQEFGVDLEEFRFDLHFAPETGAGPEVLILIPVALLVRLFGYRWPVRSSPEPVSVGHLAAVAAQGRWFRPAAGRA